ncbi:hypothetical protein FJY84_08480 [Candidatus Bathyarchaeota archaeon]|nr:hypothetical protein [Candidatus Bathyarchaeota archaeon]
MGVDLGYDFGFYIYGPYSSDLTRDAFYFFEQKEHAPKTISREPLSKEEVDAIGKVNEIRMNISPERRADELELMTSILFLKSLPYLKLESFDLIYEEIQKKKPNRFNKELVEKYYKKINEISFKN